MDDSERPEFFSDQYELWFSFIEFVERHSFDDKTLVGRRKFGRWAVALGNMPPGENITISCEVYGSTEGTEDVCGWEIGVAFQDDVRFLRYGNGNFAETDRHENLRILTEERDIQRVAQTLNGLVDLDRQNRLEPVR